VLEHRGDRTSGEHRAKRQASDDRLSRVFAARDIGSSAALAKDDFAT